MSDRIRAVKERIEEKIKNYKEKMFIYEYYPDSKDVILSTESRIETLKDVLKILEDYE